MIAEQTEVKFEFSDRLLDSVIVYFRGKHSGIEM